MAEGERDHGAIVATVGLEDEIRAAYEAAAEFADDGEEVVGIVASEPAGGDRVYLCAYADGDRRSWLAVDASGRPIVHRRRVRDAVSIAALCELAEESAGGGDIGELRARLVELRLTENPEGIEDAEVAAAELQETLAVGARVASATYLDSIGLASQRLEHALGGGGGSPFAEAMKSGVGAAEDLASEVERTYKRPLA
ncbi:MAG: hypothetical protein KY396_01785 [Actinobacteria bacterium]|nr:hypothetical protein [Actinomycetota bacterium]